MSHAVLLNNANQNMTGLSVPCKNTNKTTFVVTGQFDARVNFEATIDNITWFSYPGTVAAANCSSFVTSPSFIEFETAGIFALRPVITNYLSGVVTVMADTVNQLMTNQRRMIREDFAGVALDPTMWQVVQVGAGQSFAVGGSNLTIEAGTTPNAETIIRSVEAFPFPLRVGFLAMLSQRIANQEFIFELVDDSGTHRALFRLDGTSSTIASVDTTNDNATSGSTVFNTNATTVFQSFDIDALQDIVFYTVVLPNITTQRTATRAFTQRIPDPNLLYHVQIRVRNLAVAPASNTTLTLDAITIENLSAQTVEILSGSGLAAAGLSIGAFVSGGTLPALTTGNVQSINVAFADTSAALGANGVFTGTTRDFTTTHRVARYAAMSVSDQPGTLFIEYSADAAANTWVVIRQDTAAVIDADGVTQHVATLSTPVPAQRGRTRYRNGATANTRLRVNSLQAGV